MRKSGGTAPATDDRDLHGAQAVASIDAGMNAVDHGEAAFIESQRGKEVAAFPAKPLIHDGAKPFGKERHLEHGWCDAESLQLEARVSGQPGKLILAVGARDGTIRTIGRSLEGGLDVELRIYTLDQLSLISDVEVNPQAVAIVDHDLRVAAQLQNATKFGQGCLN